MRRICLLIMVTTMLVLDNEGSDHAIECSGGPEQLPLLTGKFPMLHNLTLFGKKDNEVVSLIDFSSFGSASIKNSLFVDAGPGIAIFNNNISGDPYSLFKNGILKVCNNIYSTEKETGQLLYCYNDEAGVFPAENLILSDSLQSWQNLKDQVLSHTGTQYQILPQSTVFSNMAPYENGWFEKVSFKGAFGSGNWLEGWTLIQESGYIND
jgi:hypothetical protein